jgi:hypothetical protein
VIIFTSDNSAYNLAQFQLHPQELSCNQLSKRRTGDLTASPAQLNLCPSRHFTPNLYLGGRSTLRPRPAPPPRLDLSDFHHRKKKPATLNAPPAQNRYFITSLLLYFAFSYSV